MKKPNVLFILADDQRYDTIHCLGNPEINTPNLDRLAKMGTAFTNCHIPGGTNGAVCMPSRCMLHTGRRLFEIEGEGQSIPGCQVTMGEAFREALFSTIGIGKWHNGSDAYARSFSAGDNIFFGGMWDHWNVPVCGYHPDGVYENKVNITPNFFKCNHYMEVVADKMQIGKHSTDLLTDTALSFLSKPQEQPFFLYLSFLAPHDPRTMPREFQDAYRPEDISLPENFEEEHPFYFGVEDTLRDEALASHPRNPSEIKQHICDYYAMISHLDRNIGRLLDALEVSGELSNTVIVYTADNGLALGQHGLMGKQNCYEPSVRVPLLIAGPGIPKDTISQSLVYLFDLYPTLCDLAGIPTPESVQAQSFLPTLLGESSEARESLYLAYTGLIRGVKDKRYKLLTYQKAPERSQLFDLEADPWERNNLYGNPPYKKVLTALQGELQKQRLIWEKDAENPHTRAFWGE